VVEILISTSPVEFISYNQAYAPGFDDMRRRKPVIDKLVQAVGFKPATTLQQIIELTAAG
jgi:UDP-glucose 4-epimerase